MISIKNGLTVLLLSLIIFQSGSATFHLFDTKPCLETKASCRQHQHYTESTEICKVCFILGQLPHYYDVPTYFSTVQSHTETIALTIPYQPYQTVLNHSPEGFLRGPPSFG